jgi:tetratricopeptide (TPR) repeat protein
MYSRLAGERARAKYAHAEAAEFFRRAAESAHRADTPDEDVAQVMESLGDVRYLVGHVEQAGVAYRSARQLVKGLPLQSARLILKEARLLQRLGRYPQTLRSLTRGIRFLDGIDTAEAAATRSLLATRYAICRVSQGRYRDAAEWGRTAVREAQAGRDDAALAQAYLAMHTVGLWSHQQEEATYGKSALALFVALDDASGQAHCLNNLAMRALFEARWTEALEMFRGAADSFRKVGDAANAANATYNVADVLIRQGHWAEAESLLKDAGRVARAVGDEELVALCARERGRAAARASRHDEAAALFAEARARFAELGEPQEVVDTDTAIAESLLMKGNWEHALELATNALERAESLGAVQILPALHRIRGLALSRSGRLTEAKAELTEGLRLSESPDVRHEQAFLLAELSEVAASEGDPASAELSERAASLLRLLGVVARPMSPMRIQG